MSERLRLFLLSWRFIHLPHKVCFISQTHKSQCQEKTLKIQQKQQKKTTCHQTQKLHKQQESFDGGRVERGHLSDGSCWAACWQTRRRSRDGSFVDVCMEKGAEEKMKVELRSGFYIKPRSFFPHWDLWSFN